MKKHDDAMADKNLFHKMLSDAVPSGKVSSHLKKDIGESKKSISDDKKLIKSLKRGKR